MHVNPYRVLAFLSAIVLSKQTPVKHTAAGCLKRNKKRVMFKELHYLSGLNQDIDITCGISSINFVSSFLI